MGADNTFSETNFNPEEQGDEHMVKPIHAKPSIYAFYAEIIKLIGLKYGYNIIPHGSFARDFDLVAIPWVDKVGDKDKMVDEIANIIGGTVLMQNRSVDHLDGDRFGVKPHGRMAYIININRDFEMKYNGMVSEIKEYSDPQYYLDISVIPVLQIPLCAVEIITSLSGHGDQ